MHPGLAFVVVQLACGGRPRVLLPPPPRRAWWPWFGVSPRHGTVIAQIKPGRVHPHHRSSSIIQTTYLRSSVTPTLAGPSGRRPPGTVAVSEPYPGSGGRPGWRATHAAWRRWLHPLKSASATGGDVHFGLLKPLSFIPWLRNGSIGPKASYPNQT